MLLPKDAGTHRVESARTLAVIKYLTYLQYCAHTVLNHLYARTDHPSIELRLLD